MNDFSRAKVRAVVFDVGETLIDETRMWTDHAARAGVTSLSFFAVLGALIERGDDHSGIWAELGLRPPAELTQTDPVDLYPDAIDCIETIRATGMRVGIAGNQPAGLARRLCSMRLTVDFIASSSEWGVKKPSREFFARVIDAATVPESEILYVGDRLDNDIEPANSMGIRTAFLMRGPWAHIQRHRPEAELADLRLDSLEQLRDIFVDAAKHSDAECGDGGDVS